MLRRGWWLAAGVIVLVVIAGAVVRNQVKVYRTRQARPPHEMMRQSLFDAVQPIALKNCRLERFGEANDGGYLLCGNLLQEVRSAYSYGIAGYDKWGCDVSTRLAVPLHQYDCFDTTRPPCPTVDPIFHAECVGDTTSTIEGRLFDTVANQLAKNGDRAKRIVMKMDVEGSEWPSLLAAPDSVLAQIDQLAIEFHWLQTPAKDAWLHDERYLATVERLKQHFYVAHLHFNNHACLEGLRPFPAWAFEVLFVNKRLDEPDPSRKAGGLHGLDAPSSATLPDCQP